MGQRKGFRHSGKTKAQIRRNTPRFWLGKSFSKEHRNKLSISAVGKHSEEQNGNWKGENAGYHSKHRWVISKLGQPNQCSVCLKKFPNREVQWANKDHKYRRKTEDYVRLCVTCHAEYDKTKGLRKGFNKKVPSKITLNGETKNFYEWCKIKNFHPSSVIRRLDKGLTPEEALTIPFFKGNKFKLK